MSIIIQTIRIILFLQECNAPHNSTFELPLRTVHYRVYKIRSTGRFSKMYFVSAQRCMKMAFWPCDQNEINPSANLRLESVRISRLQIFKETSVTTNVTVFTTGVTCVPRAMFATQCRFEMQ